VAVVRESVPTLKRQGRSFVGLCPFHKEKSPSFHVSPERGFFHCFGCKEAGSVIDFVMKIEGASFPEAVRSLAERYNIEVEEEQGTERAPQADLAARRRKEESYAAMQIAASFFETQLQEHAYAGYAMRELERRGLGFGRDANMDEVLSAFRMGYAPSSWDALTVHLRNAQVSPVVAESVGLIAPRQGGSGHYDRFRHRLMFAVTDVQGRVVAFSGRALDPVPGDDAKDRDKPAKYINSPESPIYTKGNHLFGLHQARQGIREAEEVIVVEGNFDVVSLQARGVRHVVAPLGTAFTDNQARLLARFAQRAVFLFDGDAAGRKATQAARQPARSAGLASKVARLPPGVDPDDFVREHGAKSLLELLGRAKGMLEHLIDEALDEGFSAADVRERALRVSEVSKLLSEEDDPLVRSMAKTYADQLAGRLDMVRSEDAFRALENVVKKALAAAGPPKVAPVSPERARVQGKPPGSLERRGIIEALIEWPVLLRDPEVEEVLGLLEGPGVKLIVALRRSLIAETNQLDSERFLAQVPDALREFASRSLVATRFLDAEEAKGYLLELANKLRRLLLSQEAQRLAKETYANAGTGDEDQERFSEALSRVRAKHGLKGD
jgi:DNA primase